MKQTTNLIILLAFVPISLFGQLWNKPNATWTVSITEVAAFSEHIFILHHDTVIQGVNCKNYWHTYGIASYGGNPVPNYIYGDTLAGFYFYEADSVVYQSGVNTESLQFDTLYNFKAKPNDSWTVQVYSVSELPDDLLRITVLDTGHQIFNQTNLYYLAVQYNVLNFDSTFVQDTIFEGFGSKNYMFLKLPEMGMPDFAEPSGVYLKCYTDDSISWGTNCNITIGEQELSSFTPTFYPNPANSIFSIKTNSKQASLTDLTGKTLLTTKLKNGQAQLDVSNLDNGIYFLQTDNGKTQKLIIQH